jgi:hypothetical protein
LDLVDEREAFVSQDLGRRAQQRYEVQLPVSLTYQDQVIDTTTRNISLGGMFLELDPAIPFGAVVHLQFVLPDLDQSVVVDAHVRWVQPGVGVGVQFAGLRAREVWALQKLFAGAAKAE